MNMLKKVIATGFVGALVLGITAPVHAEQSGLSQITAMTNCVGSVAAQIGTVAMEIGDLAVVVGTATADLGRLLTTDLTRQLRNAVRVPRSAQTHRTPSVVVTELIDVVVVEASRLSAEPSDAAAVVRTAQVQL